VFFAKKFTYIFRNFDYKLWIRHCIIHTAVE
jgi:hypothetical protein